MVSIFEKLLDPISVQKKEYWLDKYLSGFHESGSRALRELIMGSQDMIDATNEGSLIVACVLIRTAS